MTPRRSSRLNLTSTELNLTLTSNGGVKRPRRADNTSKSPENPNEKDYSPKPKRAKTEEVVRTPKKALNGEAKHSGEVDNHNNTAENPKRTASQLEKASTPKSNYAKTEIGVEKSPSKVRRSLQMQVSENAVHSNGHKREEVQAEKGSCNGAKNYMYDESLDKQGHYTVCHQQPNGNGNTRTPKKVLSGGSKQSGQVDNHSKTPVNSNGNELLSEKAHTPKSIYAKTKLAVEKSPSKARRSLNMQSTENDVYSNGHKTEEMQAGKGSCNDAHARNGMFEESVDKQCHYTACDQQANGNGSIRTPKKGACREPDALRTPKSPRKKANNLPNQIQKWNPKDSSQILAVKAALHLSAVPTTVICREEELKKVFEFCKMCIEKKKVGSMYVCGCPGTGKSLLLEKVKFLSIEWAKEVGMPPPTSVVVNCTSLTNTSDIFSKILEQCQGKKKCSVNSSPFQELKNFLCEKKQSSAKKMMLLIIDEMDYLISKDQAVLYDLFRLPTFPNSHCMLIGISNAIDLTDRFLPKLQSLNCKPLVMTFRAYSKEQILKILQQRLMDLPCQIFQLEALELCARMSRFESKDDRRGRHHDDDVLLGMQPPRPTATCQTSTRPSMGANADFMASKKWERPAFMNSGSAVYSPSRLTHLGSYQNKTSANLSRENTVVPALVSQTPADEGSRTGLKGSSLANLMNNGPSAPAARNTSGQSLSAGSSKFLPGNGVQESSIPASPKCVTSASRQLTIFYAGQAHVFDDIHPTKADAILALAGSNGRSWSTTYSTRPRSTLQSLATEGNVLSVEREKVGNRMTVNSSSGLDMPFELQALLPARTHAGQGNSRLGGNGHKDRTLMACPSTCSNEGDKETICNSQQLA